MRRYKLILDDLNAAKMRLQQISQPKMDRLVDHLAISFLKEEVKDLEKELLQAVRCKDCRYLREVFCHPWNKTIGKGQINERLGWVCTPPEFEGKAIYFDNNQGRCEMFEQKAKK